LKLITSNECIAQGAPFFALVQRRKYSKGAIVTARRNNSLGLTMYKATKISGALCILRGGAIEVLSSMKIKVRNQVSMVMVMVRVSFSFVY